MDLLNTFASLFSNFGNLTWQTLARSVADIKNTRMNLRSATRPNRGGQGGQNQ